MRLEELRQSFPSSATRGELPALRARVTDAALRIAGEGWDDQLSPIELRVATEGGTLRVAGRGRSRRLGDVSASASLEPATRRGSGRLAVDPAAAEGFGAPATWDAISALLRA
jgi:hypothetical protein